MNKLFLTLSCFLFASLAFGKITAPSNTNGPVTYSRYQQNRIGSVTAYEAGRTITINANMLTHDTKYVIASGAHYAKKGGGPASANMVRLGSRVELGFDGAGRVDQITLLDSRE